MPNCLKQFLLSFVKHHTSLDDNLIKKLTKKYHEQLRSDQVYKKMQNIAISSVPFFSNTIDAELVSNAKLVETILFSVVKYRTSLAITLEKN